MKEIKSLQNNGATYLDINLDTIYIDKNMKLKIDQTANSQGTPNFRAPEISCGNDEEKINLIDPQRSNIYSAGIVLYCMMKGRLPFEEGKQEEKIWKE
jgi:serine/threonine protein kinase